MSVEMASTSLRERLGDPAHTLYLVDISSFIFRAFYAIRGLRNHEGLPTNAIYGVATMIARLAEEAHPEYVGVVYDSKEPSFRKEIYSDYKANRASPPEDLIPQFDKIEELISKFEIHSFRKAGVEADDLIATLTRRWRTLKPGVNRVVIVSSDKDLMQLVNDEVCLWDTMSNKIYGPPEVQEKFGVGPSQIRDYLGLVGDSSDNIPGVEGVGPKTAAELLNLYENLDGVLAAAADGKISGKRGETIKAQAEAARLSAKLATVHEELAVEFTPEEFRYHFHVTDGCRDFLGRMDFHSLVKKWTQATATGLAAAAAPAPVPEAQGQLSFGAKAAPGAVAVAPEGRGVIETRGSEMSPAVAPEARVAIEARRDWREETGDGLDSGKRFRTIRTEADFARVLVELEARKEFGFDLETTSLNPRQAEIVGVSLAWSTDFGCYIPVGHRGGGGEQLGLKRVLEGLKPYLENARYKKIGQNLKYDWSVLRGSRDRGRRDRC